jgi:hypothetical protein
MNEPKRRGRPPKAKVEVVDATQITHIEPATDAPLPQEFARRQALAYALRVWSGQSVSLSRHERIGRVAEALRAQGLSMEGVELP